MAEPPVTQPPNAPPPRRAGGAVSAFLRRAEALPALRPAASRPRARLLFAVDATASRQPGWDAALSVQGEMFEAAAAAGAGLSVSLLFWRGFREFATTPFLADPLELARRMSGVSCLGGQTQILRTLGHALDEASRERLGAVVLVGDAAEEPPDPICHAAGLLGAAGVPVFAFTEGYDPAARALFRRIAALSGGAWAPFDPRSPRALAELLRAAATVAAGGRAALARLPGGAAAGIAGQLPAPRRA